MKRTEETVPPKGGNLTDDGAVQSLKNAIESLIRLHC